MAMLPSLSTLMMSFFAVVLLPLGGRAATLGDLLADEATRCAGKPGATPETRIVTEEFKKAAQARGTNTDKFVVANAVSDDTQWPTENGCPIYYGLAADEHLYLSVVRPGENDGLLSQWSHEKRIASVRLFWKKDPSRYGIYSERLESQVEWTHSSWRYFFNRYNRTTRRYELNYGEDNPMQIDIQSDNSGTLFEGHWKFSFYGNGEHLEATQLTAMKDLFMKNCQPWRAGHAATESMNWSYSIVTYRNNVNLNWDDVPYCEWQRWGWPSEIEAPGFKTGCNYISGAHCDEEGYITHLLLNGVGLEGTLQPSFSDLVRLRVLEMKNNRLSGQLATITAKFDRLWHLELDHNQFTGSIPCFEKCKDLDVLELNTNKLAGVLPACLMDNHVGMQKVDLSTNDISGSIPDAIGKWSRLKKLYLEENHMSGTLPDGMCKLTLMSDLDLSRNRFVGQFPKACIDPQGAEGTTGWRHLQEINVASNRMTGTLPKFGLGMKELEIMRLSYNYFDGTVTDQIEVLLNNANVNSWWSDTEFYANGNNLNGPFPPIAYNMTFSPQKLWRFDISDNHFRCERNGRFPQWTVRATFDTHGSCIPVPNPKTVTPSTGQIGARIEVEAEDVLANAQPSCRFYKVESSSRVVEAFSGAKLLPTMGESSTRKLECFVPSTLGVREQGEFKVTVANFGADFASDALVMHYKPPTFTLNPSQEMSSGVKVETEVKLAGETVENFNEAKFRGSMGEIAGVNAASVSISFDGFDDSESTLRRLFGLFRRLQDGLSVYVTISIPSADPNSAETQAKVQSVTTAMEDMNKVTDTLTRNGFALASNEPLQPRTSTTAVSEVQLTAGGGGSSEESSAVPAIIGAAAGGFLVCCLCSVICFIRHREKKGQPYFSESLEETNGTNSTNVGGDQSSTGATYGNAVEDGNEA